ncbi:Tfp pilus assembly protein FimT/FimU [Massilia oculi]|uniref:Type II secretion system protein H n=1 Tax=Massilia oculi TaxID=945844 RepID=A0A2S2DLH7_9BURK|nr:GspH/FimT family pseudopilin [Massilia oculi]AWL06161.1 hypothetical protein DIR46_18130 [Massilia oculi]
MRQHTSAGYTLLELLMVVAILSIVALVALPVSQRVTEAGADVAADEFAHALRFARDEARRKREQRLVSCDPDTGQLRVGAVDTDKDTSTPRKNTAYLVAPAALPAGSAMTILSCSFTFADNATADSVVFDATGNPVRGIGKGPMRDKALRTGAIVLGAGHVRRSVHLATTGRITQS